MENNTYKSISETIKERGVYTTFKEDTKETKLKMHAALTKKVTSLSEITGKTIHVIDIIAKKQMFDDKEGFRIVLFDSSDTQFAASGNAVLQALETAIELFGEPSIDNPISFKVGMQKSGTNAMYKYVTLECI